MERLGGPEEGFLKVVIMGMSMSTTNGMIRVADEEGEGEKVREDIDAWEDACGGRLLNGDVSAAVVACLVRVLEE